MKTLKRILYALLTLPLLFLCLADCDGPTEPTYDGPWEKVEVPALIGHYAIHFNSPNDGWSCGYYSIGHWDGNNWEIVKELGDFSTEQYNLNGITSTSSDDIWFCGNIQKGSFPGYTYTGVIIHYDGNSWNEEQLSIINGVTSIHIFDDGTGWGGGVNGIIYYDGNEWTLEGTDDYRHIFFNSKTDGWACGLSTIYHWDGTEWTNVFADYSVWFNDIFFTSPDDGWAVSGGSASGAPYQYHWDGTEWTRIDDEVLDGIILNAIHFVDSDWGWAIGGGSTFFYNGSKWTRYEDDSEWAEEDIYCVNKNDVWISQATHEYFLHFTGF